MLQPELGPIVDVDELGDLGRLPDHLVIADVRWYLDGRSGRAAYEAGHVPGAIYVDLDTALAGHGHPATAGRHPFPTPEQFAASMSGLGIGDDSTVIAYDDSGGGTAGRLVWMLRILGRRAALLNGGLRAWPEPHETGRGRMFAPARFTTRPWPSDRFADADESARAAASVDGVVLDARSGDRFRGESESIDHRAGHIPGATSAPWGANLDPTTGRFHPAAQLRAHFAELGVEPDGDERGPLICSCGSGVSACANLLGLERAGFTGARLFVASWSGWSADPDHPVATGP